MVIESLRQDVFLQIPQLLIREIGRSAMAIVGIVRLEDVEERGRSAVVQIGSGAPAFEQGGSIQKLVPVLARSRSDIVALQVR